MRALNARLTTVKALLKGQEYVPGDAQRSFRWGAHQAEIFWQDIAGPFVRSGAEAPHLLGVIIAHKTGRTWQIVDGGERLVCIMLTAIALLRRLSDTDRLRRLERTILRAPRWRYARGFALRGETEEALFNALLAHGSATDNDISDAHSQRMADRFEELAQKIDMRLTSEKELRAFTDRFLENTHVLRVAAADPLSAHAARTMLRGRDQRPAAGDVLRRGLPELARDEDGRGALKHWAAVAAAARNVSFAPAGEEEVLSSVLTAHIAEVGASRRASASFGHALRNDPAWWLKEHTDALQLPTASEQRALALRTAFLGEHWLEIERAANEPGELLDEFAFARGVGLNELWRPLALAALSPEDPSEKTTAKLATAAAFVDIIAARCAWSPKGRDAGQFEAYLLRLIAGARGLDAAALADFLTEELDWISEPFDAVTVQLGEPGHGRRTVRHILARLTAHVEHRFGGAAGGYADYLQDGATGFSIEQLIAPSGDLSRAGHAASLVRNEVRLQLGGLVLLPTNLQRELAAMPARDKAPRYAAAANLVARALSDAAGREAPEVRRYIEATNAPVTSEGHISGDDIKARNAHYAALAAALWDPRRIKRAAQL